VERRFVYEVRRAPDGPLAHVERSLEDQGFRVRPGEDYDVSARRGGDRVLVGLAPHPEGLVARVKCKALVPGRTEGLHERVRAALDERLGPPTREVDPRA
jgi:hypothetical protein